MCRLRKMNHRALTQLAIDLAAIKEALVRFPADAAARLGKHDLSVRLVEPALLLSQCSLQWHT